MLPNVKTHVARTTSLFSESVPEWANQFYQAKAVEGLSSYTLTFYRQQLGHFLHYCESQVITQMSEISSHTIRLFLLWHEETGHNPGGLHAAYRVLKTFLLWYENEVEPEGWKNPIHKVKAPKLAEEPLEPAALDTIRAMLEVCDKGFTGKRDRAIILCLLDTGARAREFTALTLEDVDLISGSVLIRQGKGHKPRSVFLGKQSRRALRAYLKERTDNEAVLWVTDEGLRLSYGGLRAVIARRAKLAQVEPPELHAFRRAFALQMLRNGCDLLTLARIMGHTSLKVLQRYLK